MLSPAKVGFAFIEICDISASWPVKAYILL